MFALTLLLSTVPSAPPTNEAESLLREMDGRIVAAKSLRIEFTIDDSADGKPQRLTEGTLLIADGNRVRYDLTGMVTANVVSDGKQLVSVFAKPLEKKSQLTPAWFNDVLKAWIGRGGTFITFGKVLEYANKSVGEEPGDKVGPRATNARLLPSEKLKEIKVHVVEYDLAFTRLIADVDAAKVRVWIDPKSKLPLRRTMTFKFGTDEKTYTAIHTKIEVDPKLDPKLFELPK
jgi:outer membrane lipoprotein-sorting protein